MANVVGEPLVVRRLPSPVRNRVAIFEFFENARREPGKIKVLRVHATHRGRLTFIPFHVHPRNRNICL